jgi:ectoine hydroxylase-related dioxygenase (phytanoyl-CoA dioxygenase family)
MLRDNVDRHGFATIPAVLTSHQITALAQHLSEAQVRRTRAGARHLMADKSIANLANDARLLNIAREILGGDAVPFRATLFDKSPEANWLVVWHQDTALPLTRRGEIAGWGPWSIKEGINYAHAPAHALERVVALRLHLDDSTAENGPLRVLPGTHKLGVLSDDVVAQLAQQSSPADCIVPQGGVLAMRPLIIHSSSKSQSDVPRRVLHIEYAESTMIADGMELAVA